MTLEVEVFVRIQFRIWRTVVDHVPAVHFDEAFQTIPGCLFFNEPAGELPVMLYQYRRKKKVGRWPKKRQTIILAVWLVYSTSILVKLAFSRIGCCSSH
jgi:hypothetical protein